MKTLAFMQNQWFRQPQVHRLMMARKKVEGIEAWFNHRASFIRRALFFRCQSGRVLQSMLGEPLCEAIIWDEMSPEIYDNPKAIPEPDICHMGELMLWHEPELVVTFGAPAREAWRELGWLGSNCRPIVINSPHPACRAITDRAKLITACALIKTTIQNLPCP